MKSINNEDIFFYNPNVFTSNIKKVSFNFSLIKIDEHLIKNIDFTNYVFLKINSELYGRDYYYLLPKKLNENLLMSTLNYCSKFQK